MDGQSQLWSRTPPGNLTDWTNAEPVTLNVTEASANDTPEWQ